MKLRVKLAGQDDIHRMELAGTATLSDLRALLVSQVLQGGVEPSSLHLSLNKRDLIVGAEADAVSTLGLCSGDTLWIMNPPPGHAAPAPAAVQPPASKATSTSQPSRIGAVGASSIATTVRSAQQVPPPQQQQQQQQQQEGAEQDVADAMDVDGPLEIDPHIAGLEGPVVPDYLQRCLATLNLQQGQDHASLRQQLLVLAVHAAMLESGFLPAGSAAGAATDKPWSCAGSTYTLQYEAAARTTGSQGKGSSAGVASMDADDDDVRCIVKCAPLGGQYLLVAGNVHGGGCPSLVRTLQLRLAEALPEPALGPVPATTTAAAGTAAGVQAAMVGAGAAAGPSTSAAASAAKPAAASSLFADLPGLWRRLKDGLALPLLVGLCGRLGLPAPMGLLSLHWELQEMVLKRLPAKDLASLACTSTQLRHAASDDTYWRPLYEAEYPNTGATDRTEAQRRGWKWAFGRAWAERKARARMRAAALRAGPRHYPYPPNPTPWAPQRPRHPLQPPFIIGGDYDRLPGGSRGGLGLGPGGLGFGGRGFIGPNLGGGMGGMGGLGGGGGMPGTGGMEGPPMPGVLGGRGRGGARGAAGSFRLY